METRRTVRRASRLQRTISQCRCGDARSCMLLLLNLARPAAFLSVLARRCGLRCRLFRAHAACDFGFPGGTTEHTLSEVRAVEGNVDSRKEDVIPPPPTPAPRHTAPPRWLFAKP